MEIWKDIEGYEGLYQISNLGNIKSLARYKLNNKGSKQFISEKIIKPFKSPKSYGAYLRVSLWKNGKAKKYSVHVLVAKTFIPNPDNLPQVNHINEIKHDNFVENLEWCTAKYNTNYGSCISNRIKTKTMGGLKCQLL